MKAEVLPTLLTAKVLLSKAQDLCFVDEKHTASSGLIVLQDALEHIFLACLIELGVDEKKSIDGFSFDQLIGELKSNSIRIAKSGTLKALNKQRVIIKHYGQVSDPSTVVNYYVVAEFVINEVLKQVIGKTIQEISLHEIIEQGETRVLLSEAIKNIDQEKYFGALVEIRKAIFVEIEHEYCIYRWRDSESDGGIGLNADGVKAPFFTKSKDWIKTHVSDPFGYIQLDHDRIRQDLMEWGVTTQDFWNVWRLTPDVIRLERGGDWLIKGDPIHVRLGSTEANARYCLDRAITLIAKKQTHQKLTRFLMPSVEHRLRVRILRDEPLFTKASKNATQVTVLSKDSILGAVSVVPGLNEPGNFVNIAHFSKDVLHILYGYVDLGACEVLIGESEDGT